ncbi:ABC transporter substrate-binding protein [Pseudorhodoferax sp.]|uniref:ABC transporter substrate-binding protein n=1 Tax=Pseudorhodoferax sp. TaxID=1993553 RepID=UPI0039E4B1F7
MDEHALPPFATRRRLVLGLAALGASRLAAAQNADELLDFAPRAAPPAGYSADYAATVRAAEDEGRLVIYATTDTDVAQPLLDDFQAMYPRVHVEYEDQTSTEMHHRFVAETQLGRDTADVLWSSAMDLQVSLVEQGYALAYASPERAGLPDWARLHDQAWATTFEPIAVAYNKKLVPEPPRTHADLAKLLAAQAAPLRGKVMTFDVEKSGLGFLLAAQDARAMPAAFWELAEAMGKAGVRFAATTGAMLRQVASGQAAVAYNVLGAYSLAQARRHPEIGVLFPSDYTLVLSRLQLIAQRARRPNAARLWVDYTLSRRGQALIARQGLYAVRADVQGQTTAAQLTQQLGQALRPIVPGAELTRDLQLEPYRAFIQRWRQAIGQPLRGR